MRWKTGWTLGLLIWLAAGSVHAQPLEYWQLLTVDRAAFKVPNVAVMPADDSPGVTVVYGDRFGLIWVVQVTAGSSREIWRSRTLDGPIYEVFCEDLDGRGGTEIVVRTQRRIYIFDDRFNQRWENPESEYNVINAMALANVDTDPAYELIVLADQTLHFVDGVQYTQEFRSSQSYRATNMAVGNVDSDFSLEIVLNEGFVIDVERESTEWRSEIFGDYIELVDIDGDGIQEILGYGINKEMRIWEADDQQEKPFQ